MNKTKEQNAATSLATLEVRASEQKDAELSGSDGKIDQGIVKAAKVVKKFFSRNKKKVVPEFSFDVEVPVDRTEINVGNISKDWGGDFLLSETQEADDENTDGFSKEFLDIGSEKPATDLKNSSVKKRDYNRDTDFEDFYT